MKDLAVCLRGMQRQNLKMGTHGGEPMEGFRIHALFSPVNCWGVPFGHFFFLKHIVRLVCNLGAFFWGESFRGRHSTHWLGTSCCGLGFYPLKGPCEKKNKNTSFFWGSGCFGEQFDRPTHFIPLRDPCPEGRGKLRQTAG